MSETVLVTGGSGYIGSHAVLALLEAGFRPVVLDDLSTGQRRLVPDGVDFVEGDAGDMGLVAGLTARHRIGAVMHLAGSIVAPESVTGMGSPGLAHRLRVALQFQDFPALLRAMPAIDPESLSLPSRVTV